MRFLLTKYCFLLAIFGLWTYAQHSTKVVVCDCVLIFTDELSPLLFACLALHVVLVYWYSRIKIWKFFLEMCVNIVVDFGQLQFGAWDSTEKLPVCHHMLDRFHS